MPPLAAFFFFKQSTLLVKRHSAAAHAVYLQPAFPQGQNIQSRHTAENQQQHQQIRHISSLELFLFCTRSGNCTDRRPP
ncbi:hypothetical protein DWUX_1923 [Desulfovibrio diazotrophicus]|nr:hypothetical protein DWUX_1923 [Desulfovibrio diazotrophicus]